MSINSYNNLNDLNIKETLDYYFEKVYEARITARSPLSLHNRNKKVKDTNSSLKNNPRYLEDFVITISDLIIFYYITLMLNKCNNAYKTELENKFSLICDWYNQMKLDENVTNSFLKFIKPAENFNVTTKNIDQPKKVHNKPTT